jgi:hypothetical protein
MGNVTFPKSTIDSSHTGPVSIENLAVGPVVIKKLTLSNFEGRFKYDSGIMKNFRLKMIIYPYADWWIYVGVDLGWPIGDITIVDESGHIDLPSFTTDQPLGDMTIDPGEMNILVDDATFGPFSFMPSPVEETNIRGVDVKRIQMVNTKVPDVLPSMLGADVEMPNPMKPVDVNVQETRMRMFSTAGIFLPDMSFRDIQALNVKIGDARSGKISAQTTSGNISVGGFSLAGFAGVNFGVKVHTEMTADNIIFNGLDGKVTTKEASTSSFTMNMDMSGIVMCNLKLDKYKIPTIGMEG